MDDSVKRMIKAFESLTAAQRAEFLKSIQNYEVRGALEESVRKDASISMGPLNGRCPYCGR